MSHSKVLGYVWYDEKEDKVKIDIADPDAEGDVQSEEMTRETWLAVEAADRKTMMIRDGIPETMIVEFVSGDSHLTE